jgi:multicomponent Na+:H+ antiporter subunit B
VRTPNVVVLVVARLLWGPSLMVAVSLIVKGYADVGDGFAAGVVVALAIALFYVGLGASAAEQALFDVGLFLLVVGVLTVLLHQFALLEEPAGSRPRQAVDDEPTGGTP